MLYLKKIRKLESYTVEWDLRKSSKGETVVLNLIGL